MDELKNLLEALKNNIDPKLQAQLLDVFEILDKENQDSILKALQEGLNNKQVVTEYQDKRKELITVASQKTQEIEDRANEKYKKALQTAESETTSHDSQSAEDIINQL